MGFDLPQFKIHCPSCGAAPEDVNFDRMAAKRGVCNSVYPLKERVDAPAQSRIYRREEGGPVPMRGPVVIEESDGRLTMVYRARSPLAPVSLIPAILMFGFALTTLSIIAFEDEAGIPITRWIFLALFAGGGTAMLYVSLALFLNRTTIRVEGNRLTSRRDPIPWPGNQALNLSDIQEFFCREYEVGRHGTVPEYRHSVEATLKDGETARLMKGIRTPNQALFIEEQLSRRLGDAP